MSLRNEQYYSLLHTREFLRTLLDPRKTKRVPRVIRDEASRCLRHFPFLDELGKPHFSTDPFGPDDPPERSEWLQLERKGKDTGPTAGAS